MPQLTADQVAALSPDDASTKQGRALANPAKWPTLHRSEDAIWGECQGSGKNPYRTGVDLREIAFKCSCPSRKFPCKHALGLLFLNAQSPHLFTESPTSGWVAEWLEKRAQSAERKTAKAEGASADLTEEQIAKREKAAAKRTENREENVAAACADAQLWIADMMRQGLASVRNQPLRSFDSVAARFIDLQAPGLARLARQCAAAVASGDQWSESLLSRIALINLLIKAYARQSELPEETRSDIRSAVGWTTPESEALASGIRKSDTWFAVGRIVQSEGSLRQQRTWLRGVESSAFALHVSYSAGQQPLDPSLPLGIAFRGELAFYPSAAPQRAVIVSREASECPSFKELGVSSVARFLNGAAEQFSRNPWIERVPCLLCQVGIVHEDNAWLIVDEQGEGLPIANAADDAWELLAISGGSRSLALFGEWDGNTLTVLSAFHDGRLLAYSPEKSVS